MARIALLACLVALLPLGAFAQTDSLEATVLYVIPAGAGKDGYLARVVAVASIEFCTPPPKAVTLDVSGTAHTLELVSSNSRGECALLSYSGQFDRFYDKDADITLTVQAGQEPTAVLELRIPVLGPAPTPPAPIPSVSLWSCPGFVDSRDSC